MAETFWLYTDGAARGNPGPAAVGAVLYRGPIGPVEVVEELSLAIGHTTNNVAEYRGVIEGLQMAIPHDPSYLVLRSDSLLLVRQLLGEYRVRSPKLQPLYRQARALLGKLPQVEVEHVHREANRHADRLANQALDS